MAFVRIDDLAFLTVAGLWVSGLSYETIASPEEDASLASFLGAVAMGILPRLQRVYHYYQQRV